MSNYLVIKTNNLQELYMMTRGKNLDFSGKAATGKKSRKII